MLLLEDESFSGTACVCMDVCIRICIYVRTYVCTYVCVFLCTGGTYVLQVQLHMCLCMYNVCMHVVRTYVCLWPCTYVSV